jgi:hypothetical protein
MTNLGVLVGTGLALALAAGCAGNAQDVSAGKAPVISTTTAAPQPGNRAGMPNIKLPDGAVPVAGSQVDASSLPSGYPRLVWTLSGGSTLGLYGLQGACQTASAQVATQTDAQVVVRLIEQESASRKPCPMYLKFQALSVTLDKPLGKRTVVLQNSIERG